MENALDSNPTISFCTFSDNRTDVGGGMHNDHSSPMVTHCLFSNNVALEIGGGMSNVSGSPVLANCIFESNSGGWMGGGIYNQFDSNPMMTNCMIIGNSAAFGGGIHNRDSSNPLVANSIVWGNEPNQVGSYGPSFSTISFSNVQGGLSSTSIDGGGNIDADPLFVDPDGPDDDPSTYEDNDYRLSAGSPCIDAGDSTAVPAGITTDLAGRQRFVDDLLTPDTGIPGASGTPVVDMGPFEYACPGNMDTIAGTTLPDFALFTQHWMETDCGTCGGADFTGDGYVLVDDVLVQAGGWLCGVLP